MRIDHEKVMLKYITLANLWQKTPTLKSPIQLISATLGVD